MSEFADMELIVPTGLATTGGPQWSTQIVPLLSGAEVRNARWASPKRSWQIAGVPMSQRAASDLIAFFNARRGPHQSFRFKDPLESSSAGGSEPPTAHDAFIGLGDGTETAFQLKLNTDVVSLPIQDSVLVAVDGIETSSFSVSNPGGVVTFNTPPAAGAVITAGFRFHRKVRFENDTLDVSVAAPGSLQLVRLGLIEVRGAAS